MSKKLFTFSTRVIVAAGCLSVAALAAGPANSGNDPAAMYRKAVNDYVTAAEGEVSSLQTQLDELAKKKPDTDLTQLQAAVTKCEELVTKLKDAGQGQFDVLKAQYERARTSVRGALAAAGSS